MQQFEQPLGRPALDLCLHPELVIAIPKPAVSLSEQWRDQEQKQQNSKAHVGLFLIEGHSGPYIQPYVNQVQRQAHTSEEEVPAGVFKVSLSAWHVHPSLCVPLTQLHVMHELKDNLYRQITKVNSRFESFKTPPTNQPVSWNLS